MHLMTGVAYYKDWQSQISFFHQLMTRAPGLQPGTTILYEYTLGLQDFRSTDNSLKAPLNWIYAPDLKDTILPLNIVDLRIRDEYQSLAANEDKSIHDNYLEYQFIGSSNQILPISFKPASCITILEPKYSGLYPHLPDRLADTVQYGNPSVLISPTITARWPVNVFGPQPEPGWCIYYAQAEAARQRGDWQAVAAIGDLAFQSTDPPREPVERFPFILGYGYTGRWKRAADLTLSTLRQDIDTEELLCSAWQELDANTPDSIEKRTVVAGVMEKLYCP
jgi:hypothetical protein